MLEFHDTSVRVRYVETDQMGVVYHANYLIWFEVGRVELMRALGVEYKRMESRMIAASWWPTRTAGTITRRSMMRSYASGRGSRNRGTAWSRFPTRSFAKRTGKF